MNTDRIRATMKWLIVLVLAIAPLPVVGQEEDADSPEQQLREAAPYGDLGSVRRLLADGASLDRNDLAGMTALMHCMWAESVEVVRLLLKQRTHIDTKDNSGNATPSEDRELVCGVKRILFPVTSTSRQVVCVNEDKP